MTAPGPEARVLARRLSPLDAAFLYIDTSEGPLNIGGVSVVDGPLSRDVLAARLRERLVEIPRYRQRAVPAPLGIGHPFWEDDPDFDVQRHIDEVRLPPPGDDAALKQAVSAIHEGMLPRDRPLWRLFVVQGFEGGRSALVSKIHHAMVDGVSGVELFDVLFDLTPDGRTAGGRTPPRTHPPSSPTQRLAEATWDAAVELVETGARGVGALLRAASDPQRTLAGLASPVAALLDSAVQPVARLPFNRPLTGKRRFSWLALSLAELRAIRAATGATLNDVVLAIVGDGVGRFVRTAGAAEGARSLRAMVPVDVRREDELGQLGNRVSIVPVEIPFDGTPLERLAAVSRRTGQVKRAGLADLVERFASAGGVAPAALYAAVLRLSARPSLLEWSAPWRDATRLTANIVCTNVPGPQVPMYAQGHLVVSHFPVVPLAFEFGLSFAVFSYNQRVFVGAIADAAAVGDLESLVSQLVSAHVDLRRAAGVEERPPVDVVRSEPRRGRGVPKSHGDPQPVSPPPAGQPTNDDAGATRRPARKRTRANRQASVRLPAGGDDER